jgi:ring-1,2-phenylacetyl-CoA epoxidase subunit PaaC
VSRSYEYVLGLGDDALIAAQRLGQWCGRAPELEEDVALANIALDQLGAARLLLSFAAELEGRGRDEDALAFLRDDHEFRNVLLVELPNSGPAGTGAEPGDFAVTIAKLLFLAAHQVELYHRLAAGPDERLAAIAAKTVKESTYHLDHATLWTVRLGDGTELSRPRMQAAIDDLWPYAYELHQDAAAGGREAWLARVEPALVEGGLERPTDGAWRPDGGRHGRHTEHLSYLLAEMQVVHRAHPGARW